MILALGSTGHLTAMQGGSSPSSQALLPERTIRMSDILAAGSPRPHTDEVNVQNVAMKDSGAGAEAAWENGQSQCPKEGLGGTKEERQVPLTLQFQRDLTRQTGWAT